MSKFISTSRSRSISRSSVLSPYKSPFFKHSLALDIASLTLSIVVLTVLKASDPLLPSELKSLAILAISEGILNVAGIISFIISLLISKDDLVAFLNQFPVFWTKFLTFTLSAIKSSPFLVYSIIGVFFDSKAIMKNSYLCRYFLYIICLNIIIEGMFNMKIN